MEIFNDTSRRVMLTTYSGGAQTNTETRLLPVRRDGGLPTTTATLVVIHKRTCGVGQSRDCETANAVDVRCAW